MMTPGDEPDVAALLVELSAGDPSALDEIVPLVYRDLRSIAHYHLRAESAGHTLNTTALVHETYLRLVELHRMEWEDMPHFMAMASRMMRRILIDFARRRRATKRGGEFLQVTITDFQCPEKVQIDDLLALDEALDALEALHPRRCRIVECRFFAGLTIEESAVALEVSPGTVKRDWRLARAWLNQRLGASTEPPR